MKDHQGGNIYICLFHKANTNVAALLIVHLSFKTEKSQKIITSIIDQIGIYPNNSFQIWYVAESTFMTKLKFCHELYNIIEGTG